MLEPEITAVLAQLSEVAARNTVGAIQTRVATAKATKQHENTVNELTEIITNWSRTAWNWSASRPRSESS